MEIKQWTRSAIENKETLSLGNVSNQEPSRANRLRLSSGFDNRTAKSARALLTVLCGLYATLALASTTGSISGTVTDAQGAVLPETTVVLRETLTGVVQTIATDSAGFYNFPSLPIGQYEVTFKKPGFEKYFAANIVIDVDSARRVDATLKIGSTEAEVRVTATDVQVDTESPQMGEVITSKEIADIPLDGRAYTDLLALQPGVAPIQTQEYSSVTPSNTDNNGLGSIAGAQDVHSGFVVNGANVVDGAGEGTFLIPNLDSIAEFRIVTNNAGAEYGGYAGGMVNVVTKSGTSQYHGDAFEYFRNGSLNATGFLATVPPVLNQNIYGGTVGGPISLLRKKAFFFADYQGRRNKANNGLITNVMSDADRTGDLSDETANFVNSDGSAKKNVQTSFMASLLGNRLGTAVTQGEPYFFTGCASTNPNTGCVFPGNATSVGPIIPQSAWDPVAKSVLQFIPKANTTYQSKAAYQTPDNYTSLADDKGAIRIDANTRFGNLWGYYHINPWDNPSPPTFGNDFPGFTNDTNGQAQLYVVGLTTPIGSTAVNTFIASYTRNKNITGLGGGLDIGAQFSAMGFASPANGGPYEEAPTQYQNWPSMSAFNANIGPQGSIVTQYNNIYEGQEDFSKVVKTHTLKVGGEYLWEQVDLAHANNGSNGYYGFGTNTTGYPVADTFIGAVSTFEQGTPSQENLRNFYTGLYAEDSWRANHNLTVNYGVRWEVDPWWREAHNRNAMALLGVQSTQFPGAPVGYVFPGDPGVPAHMANINWHDFGPRIGISYSPDFKNPALHTIFGDAGKSSVRVGYGLYHTNIEGYNTYNFSAPPYHYYDSNTAGVLFSQPFIGQDGTVYTNPFPLNTNVSPANINWSANGFLPFSPLRNPLVNSPSPYEEHIDFSVERELTSNTLLSASYVGTFGHHLTVVADGNSGNAALCLSLSQSSEVLPNTNTCGPNGENGAYYPIGGGVVNGTRGPFGSNFKAVGDLLDIGNSSYNALFLSLRHTTNRLTFLVSYTLSKAIDNGSGRGDIVFADDPNHFRGLSIYDVPNNFAASYAYELPFDMLVHDHDRVFRGWKVSGVTKLSQGVPVWMMDSGDDFNLRGDKRMAAWGGISSDMPVVAPGPLFGGGIDRNMRHTNSSWFNYNLFSTEALGTQGNTPRRYFLGPGNDNTDLRLEKAVAIKEGLTLALQAEFFDVFNHTNFGFNGVINGDIESGVPVYQNGQNVGGNFSQYNAGALSGRIGELGAKFTF